MIGTLQSLERDGLVTCNGLSDGEWRLTSDAIEQHVEHSIWLSTPVIGNVNGKVFTPRNDLPLDQCSQLDLQMLMDQNGWKQLSLTSDRKEAFEPYKCGDSRKVWFSDRNGRFFSNYLICLLKAEKLIEGELNGVYHGQIDAYYAAILGALDRGVSLANIHPWRPALWLHDMMSLVTRVGQGQADGSGQGGSGSVGLTKY